MRNMFKKTWVKSVLLIVFFIVAFFINLLVLTSRLSSPFSGNSILSLGGDIQNLDEDNIYAFVLTILFYGSLLPILLSVVSYLRKKSFGFSLSIIYTIGFELGLIGFQLFYSALSIFSIILIIINFVVMILSSIIHILRNKQLKATLEIKPEVISELSSTKMPLFVIVLNIISIAILVSVFIIPIYSVRVNLRTEDIMLFRVLLMGDEEIEHNIYFLVYFAFFLVSLGLLAKILSLYFYHKEKFVQKSGNFIYFIFAITVSFFVVGIASDMIYTTGGRPDFIIPGLTFIPMLLMIVVIFNYAILKGKFKVYSPDDEKKPVKYSKIEPLLYLILLSAVAIGMLMLPVVKIDMESGSYTYDISLTGFQILKDYKNLDEGYNVLAYLIVVLFITVGMCLVISLTSYLSKYRNISSIIKFSTIINVFFIFLFAVSGYYFQIAKEINQAIIYDLAAFYGLNIPSSVSFDYKVGTQTIYALVVAVIILIVMFGRHVFDREGYDKLALDSLDLGSDLPSRGSDQNSSNAGDSMNSQSEDQMMHTFDPCPAFSDIDSRIEHFKEDLERRNFYKVEQTTLNELIHFVVEYARNSRLHLSYTPEDIATFVSGLGASRLSILQGMSGTGKTSLPKIFSEAILGQCEIIEVESSWKDKNELLGYYNEFSMKYTPKKFTQALYKAALNKDIFTFILLDEMNLSRIEYYFSDFLSLMEHEEDKREIKLINIRLNRTEDKQAIDYLALDQGNTIKVPPNIWFIGTANRDESTFVISDKVYDRAHTMNFTKRAPKVRNYSAPISNKYFNYQVMNKLFNDAKANGNFDAESNEIIKQVEVLLAPYNISFGNRILKQIEDFVNIYKACFPNEDVEADAIEAILLSKVVAKLEVKTIEDKEKLEMDFIKLNLHHCASFIRRLDNE